MTADEALRAILDEACFNTVDDHSERRSYDVDLCCARLEVEATYVAAAGVYKVHEVRHV